MVDTIKCRECGEDDPSKLRKTSSNGKNRLDTLCRDCFNRRRRERHKNNKEDDNEKRREYYNNNKEQVLETNANWRDNNRDKWLVGRKNNYAKNADTILAKEAEKYLTNENFREKKRKIAKEWEINNPERTKARRKKYYKENKCIWIAQRKNPQYKENRKAYRKRKYETDMQYRLRQDISISIIKGLKKRGGSKNGNSSMKYLPYSIDELKNHLEKQFEPWMTWNNRGAYLLDKWNDSDSSTWKWQIDHIIPHSTFNYTSMEDDNFSKCWALENLRPYSAKLNNLEKDRKYLFK